VSPELTAEEASPEDSRLAAGDRKATARAEASGFDAHKIKPADVEELVKLLESIRELDP
jgi:hypothetical protein